MSWWNDASTEQRLAQIDGGIECGLTARQIAMNCGATLRAVEGMALYHKRHFGSANSARNASINRYRLAKRERAEFLRGNPIDFWSHEAPSPADEIAEVSF